MCRRVQYYFKCSRCRIQVEDNNGQRVWEHCKTRQKADSGRPVSAEQVSKCQFDQTRVPVSWPRTNYPEYICGNCIARLYVRPGRR